MKSQVSYGELAVLGQLFEQQLLSKGVTLCDDDYRTEALMDFVSQYEDGNDNPQLNLLYATREIRVGSKVRFKKESSPVLNEIVTFNVLTAIRPGEAIGNGETNKSEEIMYRLEADENYKGWLFNHCIGRGSELEVA